MNLNFVCHLSINLGFEGLKLEVYVYANRGGKLFEVADLFDEDLGTDFTFNRRVSFEEFPHF